MTPDELPPVMYPRPEPLDGRAGRAGEEVTGRDGAVVTRGTDIVPRPPR